MIREAAPGHNHALLRADSGRDAGSSATPLATHHAGPKLEVHIQNRWGGIDIAPPETASRSLGTPARQA